VRSQERERTDDTVCPGCGQSIAIYDQWDAMIASAYHRTWWVDGDNTELRNGYVADANACGWHCDRLTPEYLDRFMPGWRQTPSS
jgi:hypothetical protein